MELLEQLEAWDHHVDEDQLELMKKLDHAAKEKGLVHLSTQHEKIYNVYPCKVLHLEGKLSLIAEDAQDHCLIVIPVSEVREMSDIKTSGKPPKVSPFEVDEFIAAIRSMNEKEARLILKINNPTSVNLFPNYHFLGKPCMITNPNGDLIWAAYVEPGEDLFEWILSLGSHVEVLDPQKFKDDFLIYCEEKLRKVA
jgi:predicted DNA-binding transcriptional regulator YafY